jgi:Copper type II ascorbate-dependent monooxygenase, C-terminal domain
MKHRALLVTLLAVAACGTEAGGDDGPPPLTGDLYSLRYGPITVAPGKEDTRCVKLRLSNTDPIKVHQMRNLLSDGSHHLIVYKDDDPASVESATPYECTPFAGALNLDGLAAPVMITQKHEDALTLPRKVAYTFAPNQMIRIEMHYINSSDTALEVSATSEFYAVPESEIDHEANILFIGTPDIDIPAGQRRDVQAYFNPSRASLDLSGARFFAITGHTHQHGRNVTISTATSPAGERTSIYAPSPFEWSEPETTVHKPEFKLPEGLQSGFDITCSYHNTSSTRVRFGESANDEMCFFWAYYYPSKGSHVCVHTNLRGLNVDACCPEAGPQLCNFNSLPF